MISDQAANAQVIAEIFWIIVARAPTPGELREELRGFVPHRRMLLVKQLLSYPEFRLIRSAWSAGGEHPDAGRHEEALRSLGLDEHFVGRAYECLLGREADPGGLQHYRDALREGLTRTGLLKALVLSDEFAGYYQELAPQSGRVPVDTQLCELANPAKWDNPEWLGILETFGLSPQKQFMHRKPYEFAQLVYGFRRLGVLTSEASALSVGAGHELMVYWLANHIRSVVATDLYEGTWQDDQGREGDPRVVEQPEDFAPFAYPRDHLVFMRMDGRHLAFRRGTFDLAYSLSSIEHFGGLDGAKSTVREMTRVLKPGGILALATEYVLSGPRHPETFQPSEFAELIAEPGLKLVAPIDLAVYRRYDFSPIDLIKNPYQSPHMVVRFGDTVFTTVMVFLRKAID